MTATNGPVPARALPVDGAGDELLAGARLAGDQDRGRGVGDLADELVHPPHGGRPPDELVEALVPRQLVPEVAHLALERPPLERPGDHAPEVVRGERLGEVVVGAELHRLHRRADGADGGDQHHLQARVEPLQPLQHLDSFHPGQPHVEEAHVHVAVADGLDRGRPVRRLEHLAAVEHHLDGRAHPGLVVDHQDHGAGVGTRGHGLGPLAR